MEKRTVYIVLEHIPDIPSLYQVEIESIEEYNFLKNMDINTERGVGFNLDYFKDWLFNMVDEEYFMDHKEHYTEIEIWPYVLNSSFRTRFKPHNGYPVFLLNYSLW